jgi:cytochrome b subunit of formate dehydrogenase
LIHDTVLARIRLALLPLSLILLFAGGALAQEAEKPANKNRRCYFCHKKPGLTGERNGEEISMFVDREKYEASVHGTVGCVECHRDVDPDDLPHEEELAPATCDTCHEQQVRQHAESQHGKAHADGVKLAPTCVTCHTKHAMRSHLEKDSPTSPVRIPQLCGTCHTEGTEVSLTRDIPQHKILENYSLSIHGKGLFRSGLNRTAVCTSCHTSHWILPHTDPRSSINPDRVAETCKQCHEWIEDVHRKVIEGKKWQESPDTIPSCVDCHAPHKPQKERQFQAQVADCLRCHDDPKYDKENTHLKVRGVAYLDGQENVACAQCHIEIDPSKERACETIESPVDCSICHEEQAADYRISTHGTLHAKGDADAPYCTDCHPKHEMQSRLVPVSPTFSRNVPDLCARCHREGEKAAVRIHADVEDIVGSYVDSIHGKGLLESGLTVTATCSDCHSAHRELPPDDPRSTIHHDNVAETCGQCHHGIKEIFKTSIHWPGVADTEGELPSCRDCHTSHTISRTDLTDFRFHMMDQCGRCHEDEADTFFDTIHGKSSRLGHAKAAKCYDCHGTHGILPVTEPASTLSRQNVVQTCGQAACHPGAHRQFAGYLTHATHHDREKYPLLFWAFWGMTALLIGTLSFALLHTGAWLFRLARTRKEWKHEAPAAGEKLYRRFGKTQRTLHLVMLISFFTLALTGMSLKFSYMGWAQTFAAILGGFETTGFLHRVGAIVLIFIFVYHLLDVRRRKKASGQTWRELMTGPNSIVFNKRDLIEFFQSMKWFFGRGPRPRYGRFTYWEKFDYFAVFWGIAIIGSTGFVLWFPELFTHIVPGWFINVATIIHSDEALLAVGFIFTIHFFNTHFRPDKFPMDPVIFTGRVPVEEFKRDKPREYEQMEADGTLSEKLVAPFPKPAERMAKIFGFIALGVGLTLIALIIYTMVFGYR